MLKPRADILLETSKMVICKCALYFLLKNLYFYNCYYCCQVKKMY